jgi:hypothetical protein
MGLKMPDDRSENQSRLKRLDGMFHCPEQKVQERKDYE